MALYKKGERVVMSRWNTKSLKTNRITVELWKDANRRVMYQGHMWVIEGKEAKDAKQ